MDRWLFERLVDPVKRAGADSVFCESVASARVGRADELDAGRERPVRA